jgi:mediator of RNA polymerase II transcription subunit 7
VAETDPTLTLQALNRSLFAKYEELLRTLVSAPTTFETQLRELRDILVNMHYLVNSFRPHQARETVLCLLRDQCQRKDATAAHLRRYVTSPRRIYGIADPSVYGISVLADAGEALAEARKQALAGVAADTAVPRVQAALLADRTERAEDLQT